MVSLLHGRPIFFGHKKDVNMTEGSILRHIIAFALPLLFGNLFQQLYNMVDVWVVGNYVSDTAFSAVGTASPIINTLIGFFSGLSVGTGVVISQYFGAGQQEEVRKSVHSAIIMTAFLSLLFTFVGIVSVPVTLKAVGMPDNVAPDAAAYLTIIFAGISGSLFYNVGAGILRAVGDSVKPFLCLVAAAVINTGLDLLFVLVFRMGVQGVAYATIIAQFVSATLVMVLLFTNKGSVKVRLKWLKVDWRMLFKILTIGLPSALQMSIVNLSNVFVQSYINFFGSDFMGGWAAYNKIENMMFLPCTSISMAATTFIGQNMGKGLIKRSKKGLAVSTVLCGVITVLLSVPIFLFADKLVAFLNGKPEVVEAGTLILQQLIPFYFILCIDQVVTTAIRGAGKSRTGMLIVLSSFVLSRQIYLFIVSKVCNQAVPIIFCFPVTWLICLVIWIVAVARMDWKKGCIVQIRDE